MPNKPFNVALMDVNKFIEEEQLKEVSSPLIREPSSNNFQQQGLFSESIFGEIGSPTRMTRFGYINLNCQVLHPLIFQNIKTMKSLYVEIMSGKTYAVWNEEQRDFERADVDARSDADTGYMFFMNHFKEIEWRKNTSMRRDDKIDLMLNFPDLLFIDKIPVLPAGIRDIHITDGKQEKDQVNNLYMSLMNNAKAMPPNASTRPIYDSVHYAIQRKVNEIYLYIVDMMTGKKGFLEGKYGARALALGTRNVIASSNMAALSPDDPQYHKVDETKVPLYQAAKALQPLVIYNIKQFFYAGIINQSSDQIALIDPDTFVLSYQTISEDAKDRMLSSEGIGEFIEEFHDADVRFQPVTVKAADNKDYYLLLVYDDGDKIFTTRDLETFKKKFESIGRPFDRAKLRPMTRCEMLYIATWFASLDKTGTVTRYPVTDAGSVYPSKIHLISTIPARAVLMMHMNMGDWGVPIPEYPIIGANVCDALLLHPSRLGPLGGD